LLAGAPIITLSGTPMARIVADSGAGVVLDAATPRAMRAAVLQIHADYAGYATRAAAAGRRYEPKQAWRPLVGAFERALGAPRP
jgi:UDP:flavonoid glycosyltransferase YjiC (YdhE family)